MKRTPLGTAVLILVGTAAALGLGVELVARYLLLPRSGDLSRLPGYERVARELARCPASIAVVGNSAAETGVDTAIIQDAFHARGLPVPCVEVFATDGSGMTTWDAVLDRYFWSRGQVPGTVVLLGAAYSFADEGEALDVGRLARFFATGGAFSKAEAGVLLTRSQRADYAVSSWSAAFAMRHRIARRLGPTVPRAAPSPPSYHALEQVVANVESSHARLLLVAAPVRDRNVPVDSAVPMLATVIDLQGLPAITRDDFMDPLHLGPSGRATFSRSLGESLATRAGERRASHE